MLQTCELRKHQLVEAHVRMYALKKEIDMLSKLPTNQHTSVNTERPAQSSTSNDNNEHDVGNNIQGMTYYQTCPLRISQPNDERGAMLLLCLPQVVVHELNECSPLMPPKTWTSNKIGFKYDSVVC